MRERVSRWCMAAHAGNGGGPISTVSAGEAVRPTRAPRATPSAALEAAGVRGLLARGWRGCGSVRVLRWCMAAHAGDGGSPISTVSAGEGLASHPAPRMMPSPHWKRQACVARWRVQAGVWQCACAVWQACVARWRVKAGVCVRMSGVAACGTRWRVDGGGVCACACAVWQGVRVSRWCMAAHAGDGEGPISTVSAGKRCAPHPAPRMMPSPH